MSRRIAVVLFNLGGPDGPSSVRPFLRNLFNDPAIIYAPWPVRPMLAELISRTRAPKVAKEYAKMGGGSPIVPETLRQADALVAALEAASPQDTFEAFLAMRYWHPFTHEAVAAVKAWGADEVVLLPLYPQFSTTTSASSLKAWRDAGGDEARTVCCYPTQPDFVAAHAGLIRQAWQDAGRPSNVRVLHSAHGLPEITIARGDPYQWQVNETVRAVTAALPELDDHLTCFQSKVGPLEWIKPATEEAVREAAEAGKHIILSPIAFVSEHIETLVELDEEYRAVAEAHGAPGYTRVPALGTEPGFIEALKRLTLQALEGPVGLKPPNGEAICPAEFRRCACREAGLVRQETGEGR
ncbi:ferrochelatase [Marinicauda algicola]|uniref:Ferrochelatase n=1 Tax=Marinicauda algicola TaxID=2029849 RepID=A0A4V3RY49_9PROT|nr:ferrochelatase [Marinicauda algicola]TGY89019.1 ferrochelatase [Marinicauda algicola]